MKTFQLKFYNKVGRREYMCLSRHMNKFFAENEARNIMRIHNKVNAHKVEWWTDFIVVKIMEVRSSSQKINQQKLNQLRGLKQNLAAIRKALGIPYATQKKTVETISKLQDDLANVRDTLSFTEQMRGANFK